MNHKAALRTLALSLLSVQLLQARNVNPVLLATYPPPNGGVTTDVTAVGTLVYVCEGEKGLTILDASNPSAPQPLGSIDTPGFASAIVVSTNLAFVADGTAGLTILDVSDPAKPRIVGAFDTPGNCAGIAVVGNIAYLADGSYGLQIVDCSNPARPLRMGGFNTFGTALSIAVSGNYAYVADDDNGLVVVDVSNPAVARRISGYDRLTARHVALSNTYAYVSGTGPLVTLDVSNPQDPQPISSLTLPGKINAIALSGPTAYAVTGESGFRVLDISDPFTPKILGTSRATTNAFRVAAASSLAFVADLTNGLRVLAAENPSVMDVAANIPIEGHISNLAVFGDYLCVAAGQTMQIVDISKIENMRVIANYPAFAGNVRQIGSFDSYTFWVSNSGLDVVSLSDPSNPSKLAPTVGGDYYANGVGSYLFLGHPNGLSINQASPTSPYGFGRIGAFGGYTANDKPAYSAAVLGVKGTTLWASGLKSLFGPRGTYVYRLDISNLSQPTFVTEREISAPGSPTQMEVSDQYAFVLFKPFLSYQRATLIAYNWESMADVASRDAGTIQQIAVRADTLYLANGSQGVEVLRPGGGSFAFLGGFGLPDATAITTTTNYVFVGAGTNGLYALTPFRTAVRLEATFTTNKTLAVKTFGPIGIAGRIQRATEFNANSFQDWQSIQLTSYPNIIADTNASRSFYRFVSP